MSPLLDSLKHPSISEVELSYQKLNDAIIGHTKWLTEWNTRIICGIPVEAQYSSKESYKHSYFGRWCHEEHALFLLNKPEFITIKEQHRIVHEQMRAIVEKVNSDEPITRTEYNQFINSEASFSESVVNLRDDLYRLLLSYDHLTGALNRQAFFHILEQEHAQVRRSNESCCIVLLDIDNFKKINDNFGHPAGDKVLKFIANFLIENMRPYDSICRYGGEEFLICMPKTTIEISHGITDRIREELNKQKIFLSDDNYVEVSASFGIAPISEDEELKYSIDHADRALYQAKNNGRNKVEIWMKNT